jgi:hypothetical protein
VDAVDAVPWHAVAVVIAPTLSPAAAAAAAGMLLVTTVIPAATPACCRRHHHRPELERTTPVPRDELSVFTDQEAAWVNSSDLQAAHSTLESAKECAGHAKK